MKTIITHSALYWASFNSFEFRIPGEAINDIAVSGSNDDAVEFWTPRIREQVKSDGFLNGPCESSIRRELKEYGAWSEDELKDDRANWNRIVWIAAHNIAESESPDCSEPVK